jgi:hypothetical protein
VPSQQGASPVDYHDSVFLGDQRHVAPIWPFVKICTPGEGPRCHEASHHAVVLKLVPDGVCMVWIGLLEKPLELVHRQLRRTLAAVCIGRDASHTGATRLLVVAIIVDSRGRGPLKALLMPLAAAFDDLVGAVSGYIGKCPLVTARGRLPASLCRAKHDCLVAGGALGGDIVQLLELAPDGVSVSTVMRALCVVLG